jgi:hypothetical protein
VTARRMPFILVGLAVALFLGVVVSNFASRDPDGLESAVMKTQCEAAPNPEACLAEASGDPVYRSAPLPDYEITWLSGLIGVIACFAIGAGLSAAARRMHRRRQSQRVRSP